MPRCLVCDQDFDSEHIYVQVCPECDRQVVSSNERHCKLCWRRFIPETEDQHYCSTKCSTLAEDPRALTPATIEDGRQCILFGQRPAFLQWVKTTLIHIDHEHVAAAFGPEVWRNLRQPDRRLLYNGLILRYHELLRENPKSGPKTPLVKTLWDHLRELTKEAPVTDEKKWEIGDTVKLVSGGPTMTIMAVDARSEMKEYRCGWFTRGKDTDSEFKDGRFPAAALMAVKLDVE